jgi:hypothetical protein
MQSLSELCYQNLAKTMINAPPVLQEIIVGETSERITSKIKEKLQKKIRKDIRKEMRKEMNSSLLFFPHLVSEIVQDIILSMTQNNKLRTNFMEVYNSMPPEIVECAILTAEFTVREMEDRYIHSAFSVNNRDETSDDDWEYQSDNET